jgi:hypothetical protein
MCPPYVKSCVLELVTLFPCLQVSPFFENYKLNPKEGLLVDGSFLCTNKETEQQFAVSVVSRKTECSEINQQHPSTGSIHEVYQDEVRVYGLNVAVKPLLLGFLQLAAQQ